MQQSVMHCHPLPPIFGCQTLQCEGTIWIGLGVSTPSSCPFPLVFFFPLAIQRNEAAVRESGGTGLSSGVVEAGG